MKRSRTRVASLYAQLLMAMMGAGTAWADAQLVNFNAADRVPGVYEIIFKKPSELRLLPRRYADGTAGLKKPTVLADTLPLTKEALNSLAQALTSTTGGRLDTVMEGIDDIPSLFVIRGASHAAIKVLAKDPRIAVIAASIHTVPDTSPLAR